MFKILILISLMFLSLSQSFAKVEVRWFSVTSLVLEDEETMIMLDPMFTRAGIKHWLNLSELRSDEALVAQVIKDNELEKIDALFVSHSHFDHVIDAPIVSKLTGGIFYADESNERIAKAYKEPKIKTSRLENLKPIQVGKFTITPIKRTHSPIIRWLDFEFLPGPVPEDFNFSFYGYRMGDTWFYYIEHPEGKILVDQGSEPFLDNLKPFTDKVDVVIQGIANRRNDDVILEGYVKALNPKIFIPSHFDNFFFGFDPKAEISYLPGIKFEDIMEKLKRKYPEKKIVSPQYGKKIELLK
jgi:L-ascorbate metabolism protein UlaG (beta-lactamase superfamily)